MKIPKWRTALLLGTGLVISACILCTHRPVAAQAVVQAYNSTGTIQYGMIIQLANGQLNNVEAAKSSNISKMFGVVINPTTADVTLSSGNSSAPTYVATSGIYEVLVSNQNGSIKPGDYITISSLNGVGMKAATTQSLIVGRADEAFDGTTGVFNSATLSLVGNKKQTVAIGEVPVTLDVGHNPLQQVQTPDVPSFMERLAQTLVKKPVDPVHIYMSALLLVLVSIIITVMLYSGVKNAVVSVGRNPLSRHAINKSLLQIFSFGLLIFIVGLFGVYLLLKV
jgi:hypothetical protein